MSWGIAIVAGGLCPDRLAVRLGTPRKALAKFGDRTSLEFVIEAASGANVGPIVTVGGEDLQGYISVGGMVQETTSAVDNAIAASAMLNTDRIMILPADMPFITSEAIQTFASRLDSRVCRERWYAGGLCSQRAFRERFPSWESSPIFLREGRYLSGGFFAATPEGLTFGRDLFNSIRHSRKNQFAMVKKFGFGAMLRYFARMMSVADAERRLSHVLQGQVIIDTGADPVSILDFDTAEEYDEALRLFESG